MEVKEKLLESGKKMVTIFADGAYGGKLMGKVKQHCDVILKTVKHNKVNNF